LALPPIKLKWPASQVAGGVKIGVLPTQFLLTLLRRQTGPSGAFFTKSSSQIGADSGDLCSLQLGRDKLLELLTIGREEANSVGEFFGGHLIFVEIPAKILLVITEAR
jgi:hypothetical protein